jgi:hypothetical protein
MIDQFRRTVSKFDSLNLFISVLIDYFNWDDVIVQPLEIIIVKTLQSNDQTKGISVIIQI